MIAASVFILVRIVYVPSLAGYGKVSETLEGAEG